MSVRNRLLQNFVRSNKKSALGVFRDVVQRLYRDIFHFEKLVTKLTFVDTSLAKFYPKRTKTYKIHNFMYALGQSVTVTAPIFTKLALDSFCREFLYRIS